MSSHWWRHALPVLLMAMLAVTGTGMTQAPLLETTLTGSVSTYTVVSGDTLDRVSARFGVSTATLARLNGLSATALIRPGHSLVIDNRHIALFDRSILMVLNVPQRMLTLYDNGAITAYPVAVGRPGWTTPTGPFTVIEKEEHPTWDVPLSIQNEMRRLGHTVQTRVPPGPGNPLGAFFIRVSLPGVGIHGTNTPSSIYRFVTHGCIRMSDDNIASLYPRVHVGARGLSVYEPVLMTVVNGRVLVEFHPDIYRRASEPWRQVEILTRALHVMELVDWTLVTEAVRHQAGIAVDVTKAN